MPQLATPDGLFVAKQFFQVSIDATPVSLDENKTLLMQELLLAGEVNFFLEKFYDCGKMNDVDLDKCAFSVLASMAPFLIES